MLIFPSGSARTHVGWLEHHDTIETFAIDAIQDRISFHQPTNLIISQYF
jgi:hypothetical protein